MLRAIRSVDPIPEAGSRVTALRAAVRRRCRTAATAMPPPPEPPTTPSRATAYPLGAAPKRILRGRAASCRVRCLLVTLDLTVVDAFTDRPFTDRPFAGNPAAVAVVDAFPDEGRM